MGRESCPQFAKARGRCPMGDIFQYGPASPLQVSFNSVLFSILEHKNYAEFFSLLKKRYFYKAS